MSLKMYCEICGAANAEEADFCFSCKRELLKDLDLSADTIQQSTSDPPEQITSPTGTEYKILAQVGQGGYGAVYKAQNQQQQIVAIKEIQLTGLKPHEAIEATDTFHREVQVLSMLNHPSLPSLHEHFTTSAYWYMVMDFIEGQTLEEHVLKTKGRLPLTEVLDIGIQLCALLTYLHTRTPPVIFRDVKPANIILSPASRIYLIDFGTARIFKEGRPRDTIAFGSPGFAAPEQYGKSQTTARSDIYSLGATLHTLLSGEDPSDNPFLFRPVRLGNPTLPEELEQLVMRMIALDADKRPESAAMVQEQLKSISLEHTGKLLAQHGPLQQKNPIIPQLGPPPPSEWLTSPPNVRQVQMQVGLPPTPVTQKKVGRRGLVAALLVGSAGVIGGAGVVSSFMRYQTLTSPTEQPATNKTVHEGRARWISSWHNDMISSLAWTTYDSQNTMLASSSWDGTVRVLNTYSTTSGMAVSEAHTIFTDHKGKVNTVAWSPDSQYLASAGNDKQIIIRKVVTGLAHESDQEPMKFEANQSITRLAWAPNVKYRNRFMAFTDSDNIVHILDISKGEILSTYDKHTDAISSLSWGQLEASGPLVIVTTTQNGEVHIWDYQTGENIDFWSYDKNSINAAAWYSGSSSPSLALAIDPPWHNRAIQIYSFENLKKRRKSFTTDPPHDALITVLAWSPGGSYLASASEDATVRIWTAGSKKLHLIATYRHMSPVRALAWHPDGNLIASAGDDKTIHIWER